MSASPAGFLELPFPSPMRLVLSTRAGGVSRAPFDSQNHGTSTGDSEENVLENRARLAEALDVQKMGWAWVSQEHGARALRVVMSGHQGTADALWTDTPGMLLCIRVADCAAVGIAHPRSGRVGLAHAGWRGAVARTSTALLKAMRVPAKEAAATISPCLGPCCFEVGPEVAQQFDSACVWPGNPGKYQLDLGRALRAELEAAGIPPGRIHVEPRCTSCEKALFFSHRRDRGATGRMAALAWRPA